MHVFCRVLPVCQHMSPGQSSPVGMQQDRVQRMSHKLLTLLLKISWIGAAWHFLGLQTEVALQMLSAACISVKPVSDPAAILNVQRPTTPSARAAWTGASPPSSH